MEKLLNVYEIYRFKWFGYVIYFVFLWLNSGRSEPVQKMRWRFVVCDIKELGHTKHRQNRKAPT